ncbi:hypothetical protein [Bradyrhizobium barranii]
MTTAQQNEPTQQALDAFNLARIRAAQKEAESVNETNNSAKNKLRGVFAITQGQGLHNDAAREALKLVECVSAWNKDPVFGVIGIQSGPRDKGPQWLPSSHGSRGWDAGGGDDW